MVKKWALLFFVLVFMSTLALGCASPSNQTKIRCPKCGAFFDTKEGEDLFRSMQGR